MKQGMMGLAFSAVSVANVAGNSTAGENSTETTKIEVGHSVMVDALDYEGGSKLKDRVMAANSAKDLEIIVVEKLA